MAVQKHLPIITVVATLLGKNTTDDIASTS